MKIFLQQGNVQLGRRAGRTRQKLQLHQAQQRPHETEGRKPVQLVFGAGCPLRLGTRGASAAKVQGRRYGQGEQVQEYLWQGVRGQLHRGNF